MATPLSSSSEELLANTKVAVEEYDFIRFTFADMNGVSRGVVVPAEEAVGLLRSGRACFSGLQMYGPANQIVFPKEVLDAHMGNAQIIPDLATLHLVPWAGCGKYKTGQFMSETYWKPTTVQEACTRNIARRMLGKLDGMGMKFYSGMELEFICIDKATGNPVFSNSDYMSMLAHNEFDSWFCDVQKNMKKAGVSIQAMHTEYTPGQFEFTTVPEFGIKGADATWILKQGIKDMAIQRGWQANFMAQAFLEKVGSGGHFSFSVWHKDSDKNAFWDESIDDNISEFGKHWIAGMIHHAKALTALCCITTNCYQRLHKTWVPHLANWGIQDRASMVRVKNDGPGGTYFENRIPSALFNPYLVMAATIAAGIDGVVKKTPCPKPHDVSDAVELPHSLEEALAALQEDEVMVEALGETYIRWFLQSKTEAELQVIKGITDERERMEVEYKQYSRLM